MSPRKSNSDQSLCIARSTRPVRIVFRPTKNATVTSINGLIDGGLAKLFAAKIAVDLASKRARAE
jgi:hypothetical protein